MEYNTLMNLHLLTVVPCFFIGGYLLLVKKGTPIHKQLGKVYMALMVTTAIITLFMPAEVGPQLFGHFGYLHSFSILTLYTIPSAIIAIKNGNVRKHKINMILLYIGAIIIAGGFTFVPGRYLYTVFFGG